MHLEHLTYHYPGNHKLLFDDLSFCVQEGELNFLIGRNGVGKSTLLDIFLGLRQAHCVRDYCFKNNYLAISQGLPMLGRMTCLEIAQLILGVAWKQPYLQCQEIEAQLPPLVNDFFADKWQQYYYECSGGEQRLVQLFLFLQVDKACYILDEPTSSLDRRYAALLLQLLAQMQGKTIVMVTHDYRDFKHFDQFMVHWLDERKCYSYRPNTFKTQTENCGKKFEFLDYFVHG